MLKIVTQEEYQASSQELRDAIDKIRLSYAEYLRATTPAEFSVMTLQETVDCVRHLHETGFLGLVTDEAGEYIYVVPCLPCTDGVHTVQCTTREQHIIYGELIESLGEKRGQNVNPNPGVDEISGSKQA